MIMIRMITTIIEKCVQAGHVHIATQADPWDGSDDEGSTGVGAVDEKEGWRGGNRRGVGEGMVGRGMRDVDADADDDADDAISMAALDSATAKLETEIRCLSTAGLLRRWRSLSTQSEAHSTPSAPPPASFATPEETSCDLEERQEGGVDQKGAGAGEGAGAGATAGGVGGEGGGGGEQHIQMGGPLTANDCIAGVHCPIMRSPRAPPPSHSSPHSPSRERGSMILLPSTHQGTHSVCIRSPIEPRLRPSHAWRQGRIECLLQEQERLERLEQRAPRRPNVSLEDANSEDVLRVALPASQEHAALIRLIPGADF